MKHIHELETKKEEGTYHSLRTITTYILVSKRITLKLVLSHKQKYLTNK